jgi:hypothetical protein
VWQIEAMPIIDNHEIESGHFKKHPKKWSSLFLFHSRDNRKKNCMLNETEKSGKNWGDNRAGHLEICRKKKIYLEFEILTVAALPNTTGKNTKSSHLPVQPAESA